MKIDVLALVNRLRKYSAQVSGARVHYHSIYPGEHEMIIWFCIMCSGEQQLTVIVKQPKEQTATIGGSVTFTCIAYSQVGLLQNKMSNIFVLRYQGVSRMSANSNFRMNNVIDIYSVMQKIQR